MRENPEPDQPTPDPEPTGDDGEETAAA